MYDGSLGTRGPWEALVTFQQMIVLCDRRGIVDMTADVISRRTLIPVEIISKGIGCLLLPDPESRDPAHEGRRIEPLDQHRSWGWRILNYEKYRAIRTAEDRREYNTAYQRERRARMKEETPKPNGPDVPDESPIIENIPMVGGSEFGVRQAFVSELERLYPNVDVPATLKQMRGWCLGNPTRLKTPRGIRRFIIGWCERDQNRG